MHLIIYLIGKNLVKTFDLYNSFLYALIVNRLDIQIRNC